MTDKHESDFTATCNGNSDVASLESIESIHAVATLNALRNGQPTPAFMAKLSPNATLAMRYLSDEIKQKRPILKILVGNPGAGKTTFKQLFAASVQDLQQIALVDLSLAASSTFNARSFFAEALFDERLILRVLDAVRNDKANYNAEVARKIASKSRISGLLNAILCAAENANYTDAGTLCSAAKIWFSDSLKTALTREITNITNSHTPLPDVRNTQSTIDAMNAIIKFYIATGVYPIWVVDEFESYTTMNSGIHGRIKLLSIFRDLIDIICDTKGAGLIILSTNDGLTSTAEYPALRSRLRGCDEFSLPQTLWYMHYLTEWDAELTASTIEQLYQAGAQSDQYVCAPVANALPTNIEQIRPHVHAILKSHLEPRDKLQEVVANTYDMLANEHLRQNLLLAISQQVELQLDENLFDQSLTSQAIPEFDVLAEIDALLEPTCHEQTPVQTQSESELNIDTLFDIGLPKPAPTLAAPDQAEPPLSTHEPGLDYPRNSQAHTITPDQTSQHTCATQNVLATELRRTELYEILPSGSLMHYSPPELDYSSDSLVEQISKSIETKHMHVLGKRISLWRNSKSLSDLPLDIIKKARESLPDPVMTWHECKQRIEAYFSIARYSVTEFAVLSRINGNGRNEVTMINPLLRLSQLRSFIYQYALQNGILPEDSEIDAFILDAARNKFDAEIRPARGGIRFNGVKRGLFRLGSLFSGDEFIADVDLTIKARQFELYLNEAIIDEEPFL